MMRRLAEIISRRVTFEKKLPAEFQRLPLYVSPDSALKFWKPGFGAELKDLLRIATSYVQPGDSVWDIGANVGVFTFGAAARCGTTGHVLSVEADTFLATLLQRSRLLPPNRAYSIEILCPAVSDENRILNFQIAERGRSANSLEKSSLRSPAGGVRLFSARSQLYPRQSTRSIHAAQRPQDGCGRGRTPCFPGSKPPPERSASGDLL